MYLVYLTFFFCLPVFGKTKKDYRRETDSAQYTAIDKGEVSSKIKGFLGEVSGHKVMKERKFWQKSYEQISEDLNDFWEALPKFGNPSDPRISEELLHFLLHEYFMYHFHWHLEGLSFHGDQDHSPVEGSSVKTESELIKLITYLVEEHIGSPDEGFTRSQSLSIILIIEHMITRDSVDVMLLVYDKLKTLWGSINAFDKSHQKSTLIDLFQGYKKFHDKYQAEILINATADQVLASELHTYTEFAEELVVDFLNHHPVFVKSEDDVEALLDTFVHFIQDRDRNFRKDICRHLHNALKDMDTTGTGRLPIDKFRQLKGEASRFWTTTEPVAYLKAIGAVEENDATESVVIPNYVMAKSNCNSSRSIYSICCSTGCESLMQDLRHYARAPALPVKSLIAFLNKKPPFQPHAKPVSKSLEQTIRKLAEPQAGLIYLHSPELREILHLAYPQFCPSRQAKLQNGLSWTDYLRGAFPVADDAGEDPVGFGNETPVSAPEPPANAPEPPSKGKWGSNKVLNEAPAPPKDDFIKKKSGKPPVTTPDYQKTKSTKATPTAAKGWSFMWLCFLIFGGLFLVLICLTQHAKLRDLFTRKQDLPIFYKQHNKRF